MSNYLTIATVTEVLRDTLDGVFQNLVGGGHVTTVRPDKLTDNDPMFRANLYLYHVSHNTAWRNHDVSTRNSNGQTIQRSRVALDLHYLISCYGADVELGGQRALGSVVQALHETPLLSREKIRKIVDNRPFLKTSNLADELELVRFTPSPLSLEELSKLWSVFFQTPYTLSVAYQASVVFIESEETYPAPLPVREPKIYAMPFRQPVIESIEAATGAHAPIISSSTLIVRGRQLRGDITKVRLSGKPLAPDKIAKVAPNEIQLPVPPNLPAGVQTIQVLHQINMGQPATPHNGPESNASAFMLCPTISPTVSKSNGVKKDDVKIFTATITVEFEPNVGKSQRVTLSLDPLNPPKGSEDSLHSYSFAAPKDNGITVPKQTETDSIDFAVSNVVEGDYLVRVLVDGAASVIRTDDKGPYSGIYSLPRIGFK